MKPEDARNQIRERIEQIPDENLADVLKYIDKNIPEEEIDLSKKPPCPYCHAENPSRDGMTKGNHPKQRYSCKSCGKSYTKTTNTATYRSNSGVAAWKTVVEDTLEGISIDKTADKLGISHSTVFNMRHKILCVIEEDAKNNPVVIGCGSDTSQLDETFVLENYKGKKLPKAVGRKPRLHKPVAQKRGISDEYVCVCTGIDSNGVTMAVTVNRATPNSNELSAVFKDRIDDHTIVLADGGKGYPQMAQQCGYNLINAKTAAAKGQYDLNRINSFHSFYKNRYGETYHGVATKYINRYNAMLSLYYTDHAAALKHIYYLLGLTTGELTNEDIRTKSLLNI